ncbi:MAG: sigma-70 family RNA polymerase sigma factor [Kofleriaceae bacterium]
MDQFPLADGLLRRFGRAGEVADRQAIERRLQQLVDEALATWSGVALAPVVFVDYLADRIVTVSDDPLDALRRAVVSDIYLACGCTLGDPRALDHFERAILTPVVHALKRRHSQSVLDELAQVLRARLLVVRGEGEPPRIADYSGLGPLTRWLRVIAVRELIDLIGDTRDDIELDPETGNWPLLGVDTELDFLKASYRSLFSAAFRAAFAALEARERNLLRYYYVDGLRMDRIAGLYKVTQPTVSRWIKAAQDKLLDEARRGLLERLGGNPHEIESLLRLMKSQIELSLRTLLGNPSE